jgi:hypothetical protein
MKGKKITYNIFLTILKILLTTNLRKANISLKGNKITYNIFLHIITRILTTNLGKATIALSTCLINLTKLDTTRQKKFEIACRKVRIALNISLSISTKARELTEFKILRINYFPPE